MERFWKTCRWMDRKGRNWPGEKSLAVDVACMAMYRPAPGLKGKGEPLSCWFSTDKSFISVSALPHFGVVNEQNVNMEKSSGAWKACLWLLLTFCFSCVYSWLHCAHNWETTFYLLFAPQWGAADAEIKVPSGENTELKRSPYRFPGIGVFEEMRPQLDLLKKLLKRNL